MTFTPFLRFCATLLVIGGLGLAGGCATPDHWALFGSSAAHRVPVPPADKVENRSLAVKPVEFAMTPPTQADISSFAPESAELSIEQAVMLALRNNRDLQVRQLEPVIVGSFEQIERGVFDPELFAEGEYGKERSSETSRSSGSQYQVSSKDSSGVVGLRQALPTGTTVEASVAHERAASDRAPEQQTARLGLSLTQSLLRGFGPAVNLARVRQAELDTLASIEELRGFTEALLADTEIAYWQYVLSRDEIAIFEQSLQIARKQLEEIELRIEVGILPEIEGAAAKAEEALRVQNLIDARSQMVERRLRLLRLINPNSDDRLDQALLAVSEPRLQPEPITDLDDRLQLAEQLRPDLNEARQRLRHSQLETVLTRNGLLPRLDLFIVLGKTGYSDTFSAAFRELDGNTYDFTAGIRLSHFLGSRTAEGRNLAALASRQQARQAVANLRQLVRFDVRLAVNEVERNRQQIDATRATRILQEQTLNAEKERFDVGTSTSLQVAQAQRDLLRIQIAEVESIINYRIALVRLYLAEGSLLQRRGIEVAGGAPALY